MPLKYPLTETGPGDPIKSDDWNNIIRSIKDLYNVTDALSFCPLAVKVYDKSGTEPVTNANVMVKSLTVDGVTSLPDLMVGLTRAEGLDGVYFSPSVPPGEYALIINAPDFAPINETIKVESEKGWCVHTIKLADGGDEGVVPMLFGLKAKEAVEMLALMDWELGMMLDIGGNTIADIGDLEDENAVVLSQTPPPGATALYKDGVNLVLSGAIAAAPADQKEIPNVVGQTLELAKKALEDQGFVCSVVAGASAEDLVSSQVPSAGTMAAVGSTVVLLIKEVVEEVTVPGVHGLARDDAGNVLSLVGLKTARGDVELRSGVVVNQLPKAGDTVEKGDSVALTFKALTGTIHMPDLRSVSVDVALKGIYEAGLTPGLLVDSFGRMGSGSITIYDPEKLKQAQREGLVVMGQIPTPNALVIEETCVYLAVEKASAAGSGINWGKTPGVTGDSLAKAIEKAEDAGITVVVNGDTSGKINMGSRKVVNQWPKENEKVASGGIIRVELETVENLAVDEYKLNSRNVALKFKDQSVADVQAEVMKEADVKAIIRQNKTYDDLTGMERETMEAYFVKQGLTKTGSSEATVNNVYDDLRLLCNL